MGLEKEEHEKGQKSMLKTDSSYSFKLKLVYATECMDIPSIVPQT